MHGRAHARRERSVGCVMHGRALARRERMRLCA